MLHEKQENIILSGQTMAPPSRFQGGPMENKILPSSSGISDIDFLAESSRKRKSTAMDQQGTISESVFNYCFPRDSKLQRDADSCFGINIQGNTPGLFSNQTPQSIEPITFRHRYEKDQVQGQNDFTATWQTGNRNFHKTEVDKISNSSLSVPPQSFHHRGPLPLIKMSTGGILAVSNWQPQEHNIISQTEAHKSLPFLKSCNARTENAEVGPGLHNLMSFGNTNHVLIDNPPLEVCNPQSDSLRPLDLLRQSFVNPDRFAVDLDGRACSQEARNSGISCDLKQSGHSFNTAGINDISTVETASLGASACTERNENDRSLQNEVQSGTTPLGVGLGDDFKDSDQGHGDENMNIMKKTERSDIENSSYSLTEEASPKNGYSPVNVVVGQGQRNDQRHGSLKFDEKSKSLSGKVAPTFAEKLWDGSLHLSSSVTVSAVAFFKSGEKMPDVNWSEFVEVKGKVRLEAFEKYIQDLPRSRNRGLMVISLCWKEGSPETGLAGMKEVAKGYKKGERVGFAQLSPGIDLYICPRSDTIITILAKYGFFKGMAAVEDNQDSMIGCVVWRRNRTSSSSVEKKSERKNHSLSERPLNSPSDSSTQRVVEKKLSVAQPAQEPSSIASATVCPTLESAGNNIIESKNIESGKVQLEVCNSSTGANSFVTPSVPSNSPSISASLRGPMGHMEVEAPLNHGSELEKPKASLELQKPALPLPSDVIKPPVPSPDDDDLPEFDFRTACGISQPPLSKPLNAATLDKRLPAEGFRKMNGSLPPTMPIVQSIPVSNQRKSENLNLPRPLPLDANQGMHPPKKVCERESQIPVLPILEEKHTVQSRATMNRFVDDDDDDIPEWCPPDLMLRKQSLAETSRPATTSIPSKVPNSTFESFSPGPPRPLLPSPSPPTTHPSFSPQAFPPSAYQCPITITVKAAQPRHADGYMQRGPSPSMGFNPNPVLRPPPNPFNATLPIRSAAWRGWRP